MGKKLSIYSDYTDWFFLLTIAGTSVRERDTNAQVRNATTRSFPQSHIKKNGSVNNQ